MEYRILDYKIKEKGRINDALSVVFGLGDIRRKYILDLFGFGRSANIKYLNYYLKDCLRIFITSYTYVLGSPLRLNVKRNIEFLVKIWTYRGLRFKEMLPMRGQSTRSNAKTIKYTVNFFKLNKW